MSKEELLAQGAANYKALLLPVRPGFSLHTKPQPWSDPIQATSSHVRSCP